LEISQFLPKSDHNGGTVRKIATLDGKQ